LNNQLAYTDPSGLYPCSGTEQQRKNVEAQFGGGWSFRETPAHTKYLKRLNGAAFTILKLRPD
jgi:hypothetical protein